MNNAGTHDPIVVLTTSDDRATLEKIADALIEKRIAACVQVGGPISSTYRWEGKSQRAEEWTCSIKTMGGYFHNVELTIRELHNYEQPQILGLAVTAGGDGYLTWMMEQLV